MPLLSCASGAMARGAHGVTHGGLQLVRRSGNVLKRVRIRDLSTHTNDEARTEIYLCVIVFLNRGPESVSERGARRRAAALTKVSSAGQSPLDATWRVATLSS